MRPHQHHTQFHRNEQTHGLHQSTNDYLSTLCETVVSKKDNGRYLTLWNICHQVSDRVDYTEAKLETYVSTESLLQEKRGRQHAQSLPATGKVTHYKIGDTLISNIRPYFKKIWFASSEGTCSNDVLVFRANDSSNASFLYACLRQDSFFRHITKGAKGTKMPRGDKKQIMDFCVSDSCSPEDKSLIDFLVKQISENDYEAFRLQMLRDALLPKLIAGEIDVSNIDLTQPTNNHLPAYRHNVPTPLSEGTSMENTINAILSQMQSMLNPAQFKHLAEVLKVTLLPTQKTSTSQNLLVLFLTAKEVEGCSPKTIAYYENTLQHMTRTLSKPYTQINSDDLREYLNDYEYERKAGKVTIDNIRRIMSSFFGWLEDEDYIVKSPVRRIHRVKTATIAKEILSDENLETLRDQCDTMRDLAVVDILTSTGMRVGELVGLDIADVNLHERECLVTGKGNKQRPVYFDARTKLHLAAYLESRNDDNPALFVSLSSQRTRITIGGIERRLKELGKKAGVNRVHPHKFRRTLATHAIDKGMPIEQVQKLLGHARIDTTMHYAMVNQNNVKASHRRYLE